jgi:hypothetical protein
MASLRQLAWVDNATVVSFVKENGVPPSQNSPPGNMSCFLGTLVLVQRRRRRRFLSLFDVGS